jgi:hypothetical protein
MTFKSVKISRSVMFYNEQGKEEWVGIAPIVELTDEESEDFEGSVDKIFERIDPIIKKKIPESVAGIRIGDLHFKK